MYRFKKVSIENYDDIIELYNKAFNLKTTKSEIYKKYDTTIFGSFTIGLIAETEKKEIAAYYGVFPIGFKYKDESFLVAQSGDTMTSLNHRKKGLFTQLATQNQKKCISEGLKFIYGFPNNNSMPGFERKLGWRFYGNMKLFTLKISTLPLCEGSEKFRFLKPMYNYYVRKRLKCFFTPLTEDNITSFNTMTSTGLVAKDMNYFVYKLKNLTNYFIEYNKFKLLIKTDGHMRVGVVGFFNHNRLVEFLKSIDSLAKMLGCKKVIFIMNDNHWLFSYLKNAIPYENSLPVGFFEIDKSIDYSKIEFTQSDYDTF
jgi:hypothetical protein